MQNNTVRDLGATYTCWQKYKQKHEKGKCHVKNSSQLWGESGPLWGSSPQGSIILVLIYYFLGLGCGHSLY